MKKIISLTSIFAALLIIGVAQSAENNSTLTLQKDKGNGLFILNMKDSQGIKSFSLVFPTDKLPYSGDLTGCPPSRKIDNITINDPSDFKPLMNAVILDCQGNETEFEIGAPENGVAQVKKAGIVPPPPPPIPATPPKPKEDKPATTESKPSEKGEIDPFASIQYPIKELENCESKDACKTYCEKPANLDRCIAFAEANGLLKHDEIERGKKFSEIVKSGGGPAGCKTEKACFEYCNDVSRIDECVAFAEKNGFMEGKELEEAKKIQSIVRSGKSMPGNCKNRTACEAYCKNTEHMDECIAFAKESGFMSAEEIAEAEKFLPLMKSGQTPGGCKSREECDAFCNADDHFEECFAFADKAGIITDKEREIMKKTGGKGPGGCRGRACQTFCENPANEQACFEFAKQYGLISDEDLSRMEEGKRMLREQLEHGPPEIQECLKSIIGVPGLEAGGFVGGPELGMKMRECFEKLIPEGSRGQFEFGEGGEFHGPGGCKSREECEAYCKEHQEECGSGGGSGQSGFSGPGGCTSQEECMAYCTDNPEACKDFQPPSGAGGGGFPRLGGGGGTGLDCSPKGTVASFVCGKNGRNAPADTEITYFNSCTAKEHGAEIIHEGVCKGHVPCADVADPVCGNDGNTWVSACYAEERGGGVKYNGACKSGDTSGFSGPGGCKTREECNTYCTEHHTDPACGGGGGNPVVPPFPPQPSPSPTSSCVQPPSDIVNWPNDDVAQGNFANGVTIVSGKVGNAFKFDGNGYINMENPANLNFGTGPFSLETWFNWDGGGSSKGNIIRKSNYPVSGNGAGYWLVVGKDNRILEFFTGETVGNAGQQRGSISTPISSGGWHHAAATRDGSGTMNLYLDGQLKGTAEAPGAETTSSAPFTLGAWDDRFGVKEFYSGLLDEVTVYNKALSASEVQAIFNAGSAGKCSDSSSGGVTAPPTTDYQQQYQQQQFQGPGGCTTPETCRTYCTQHYQDPACQQFMPSSSLPTQSPFAAVLAPFLELLK